MQLATTTATTTPVQPPLWGPGDLGGRYIGTAVGNIDDTDGYDTPFALRTGERIGMPDGYSSLEQAMTALAELTSSPDVGGAAVLERDGRFYGTEVLAKDLVGSWGPGDWAPFEWNDGDHAIPGEWYITTDKHLERNGVAAVLDGDYVLHGPNL